MVFVRAPTFLSPSSPNCGGALRAAGARSRQPDANRSSSHGDDALDVQRHASMPTAAPLTYRCRDSHRLAPQAQRAARPNPPPAGLSLVHQTDECPASILRRCPPDARGLIWTYPACETSAAGWGRRPAQRAGQDRRARSRVKAELHDHRTRRPPLAWSAQSSWISHGDGAMRICPRCPTSCCASPHVALVSWRAVTSYFTLAFSWAPA